MALYQHKYRIESARLKDWDYSIPGWYYITICTKCRRKWFGEIRNNAIGLNLVGRIIEEEWKYTAEMRKNISLDIYCIMPNHIHGILIIDGPDIVETLGRTTVSKSNNNLSDIVRGFKASSTKRIHKAGYRLFSWQPRFYDHIIRNDDDLKRIREYIYYNPLKWELDEYYKE